MDTNSRGHADFGIISQWFENSYSNYDQVSERKYDEMTGNLSRETETIKMNQMGILELKNKIYEVKYSLVGLNSKVKMKESHST